MEDFLKKYLTTEELDGVRKKYLEANPGAKGLPTYISKARLDEVLDAKKKVEKDLTEREAEIATLGGKHETALKDLEAKLNKGFETTLAEKLALQGKDFELTEAIYGVKGRNVKAIKALVDTTKDPKEELTRIQKEAPYLFEENIPGGTGKHGEGGAPDAEQAAMRRAVGL